MTSGTIEIGQVKDAQRCDLSGSMYNPQGQWISRARQCHDSLRTRQFRLEPWYLLLGLQGHRSARGQRLPAPTDAAVADRAGGIDALMAYLGVRAAHAAVDAPSLDEPTPNPRSHGDHRHQLAVPPCAQPALPHGRRIGVILQGHWNAVALAQGPRDVHTVPSGQRVGIVDRAPQWIDRTGAANSYGCQLVCGPEALQELLDQRFYALQAIRKPAFSCSLHPPAS
jgi:hypothetical protein